MKTIAEVDGLTLRVQYNRFCDPAPWFAYVSTGMTHEYVGSAAKCLTEHDAIESALCDAERRLEALRDKAQEGMAR